MTSCNAVVKQSVIVGGGQCPWEFIFIIDWKITSRTQMKNLVVYSVNENNRCLICIQKDLKQEKTVALW